LGTASTAADLGQEQLVSTRFHQFLPLGGALPPVERLLGSVWWLFAALTVFALVTLLLRWDSRPATA
jgi:hypothetical protein